MKDDMRFYALEWTPPHGVAKRLRRRRARKIVKRAWQRFVRAILRGRA